MPIMHQLRIAVVAIGQWCAKWSGCWVMNVPRAVIIGAVIIAATIIFALRYEIAAAQSGNGNATAFRLDHWTGNVTVCAIDVQRSLAANKVYLDCSIQ